jgi:glycosyltransferase involved in cell wall biosynthesis
MQARSVSFPRIRTFDSENDLEVSVVMPCLNEARTVGRCVEKALSALEDLGIVGEVVVADNGSIDGSQEIARA